MSWSSDPPDSWLLDGPEGIGLGFGEGELDAALAHRGPRFLNGRVSATLQIPDWRHWGAAGVCLRVHDPWCAIAFHVCPDEAERGTGATRLVLARYWDGRLQQLARSAVAFPLADDTATFSLHARSRALLGVLQSGDVTVNLEASDSVNCFAGSAGLIKFYRSRVRVRGFTAEVNAAAAPLPVDSYRWDALCSYATSGRAEVEAFVGRLASRGLRIWTDWTEIRFGDSIIQKIQEGLAHSRRILICVTPGLAKSSWSRAEYGALLTDEITNQQVGRVVPVLFPGATANDIPPLLRERRYVRVDSEADVSELGVRLREALTRG